MMKRTVMRCGANYSGQAWPGQAIEAVLPRGSLRRFFPVPISSPDTMTAHWRHRDPSAVSTRSSLQPLSDPHPRSSRQSIPIAIATPPKLEVKTSALTNEVRKVTENIAALMSSRSAPDLVLNRHCVECEFRARCRQRAAGKDDLSLLRGMTEKERKNLHRKGIFTVTQLSYTFRPRRKAKRLAGSHEKYHHSIRALAIRDRKIYIVGSPELNIHGTPVYFDVEGLPDRDFYYLIGLRVRTSRGFEQHSLWADSVDQERRIWADFLGVLSGIDNPVLIHYGRYV